MPFDFVSEVKVTIFEPLNRGNPQIQNKMAGVNEVILVGQVGQDPEKKELNGGKVLVKFSLATNRTYKDKTTGEKKTETQWHRIEAWNALAETIATWVKKGQQLYIRGELRYGKYEKDGVTHYTTTIMAEDFTMLGGRPDKAASNEGTADSVRDYKTGSVPAETVATVSASSKDVMHDDSDDLPF